MAGATVLARSTPRPGSDRRRSSPHRRRRRERRTGGVANDAGEGLSCPAKRSAARPRPPPEEESGSSGVSHGACSSTPTRDWPRAGFPVAPELVGRVKRTWRRYVDLLCRGKCWGGRWKCSGLVLVVWALATAPGTALALLCTPTVQERLVSPRSSGLADGLLSHSLVLTDVVVRAASRPARARKRPSRSSIASSARTLGRVRHHHARSPDDERVPPQSSGTREARRWPGACRASAGCTDLDTAIAGRFGALTSGHALLYDAGGRLRFSGGLTAGADTRATAPGSTSVRGRSTDVSSCSGGAAASVFGCALAHDAAAGAMDAFATRAARASATTIRVTARDLRRPCRGHHGAATTSTSARHLSTVRGPVPRSVDLGIAVAMCVAPYTWRCRRLGHPSRRLGGRRARRARRAPSPRGLALTRPGEPVTRHAVAVGQMCTGVLIHLTGGRIETHFHVFGSLAFLAAYRDCGVLITATAIVVVDHSLRAAIWPYSVFGVATTTLWRPLEHAAWVVFEDVVLFATCARANAAARLSAEGQVTLEDVKTPSKRGSSGGLTSCSRAARTLERVNAELREATDRALESSRAKSAFLATVSHEVRTPMNGIIGVAELLRDTPLENEQLEYVEIIDRSGHALLGIINDILDFSKLEAGKLEVEAARSRPLRADRSRDRSARASGRPQAPRARRHRRRGRPGARHRRCGARQPGAAQPAGQRGQVHRARSRRPPRVASGRRGGAAAAIRRRGHRLRHRAGHARAPLPALHASRRLDHAPIRRDGPRPRHLPQPRGAAGRHALGHQHARPGLDLPLRSGPRSGPRRRAGHHLDAAAARGARRPPRGRPRKRSAARRTTAGIRRRGGRAVRAGRRRRMSGSSGL